MEASEKIRNAYERSVRGLTKRPELGRIARSVTARMVDGLTCALESDGHQWLADSVEVAGGNERGPSPVHHLQGALACCLAIGYRQGFAARDLPVEAIEVEVTATTDACSSYGLPDATAGFLGPVTCAVRVESPADPHAVREVLDFVDAHSPVTHALRNPVELRHELDVRRGPA